MADHTAIPANAPDVERQGKIGPRATGTPTTPPKPATARRRHAERRIGSKCRPDCQRPTAAQAHCSVCHVTFGGVTNFNRHRDDGWCLDPSGLGLAERDGVWRSPMAEASLEQLRAARAVGLGEGVAVRYQTRAADEVVVMCRRCWRWMVWRPGVVAAVERFLADHSSLECVVPVDVRGSVDA